MEYTGNKEDLYFGPFHINRVKRALWRGDLAISLSPTEIEVLLVLVESQGRAASAESILAMAWHGAAVELNNVHQVIRRVRQKLGPDETGQDYILRNNVGYMLAAVVTAEPVSHGQKNGAAPRSEPGPEAVAAGSTMEGILPASQSAIVRAPLEELKRSGEETRRFAVPWQSLALVGAILVAAVAVVLAYRSPRPYFVPQTMQLTRDGRPKREPLLFDGKRLWFQEAIKGAWQVVSVAATGGQPQSLNLPFKEIQLLNMAGDGSALLLQSQDGGETKLWSWPLTGGDPQLLPLNTGDAGSLPTNRRLSLPARTL